MTQRFSAWNFKGKTCPACGFPATLLYVEVCKKCWGSLLECPKCKQVNCYGTKKPSGIRSYENYARSLATKWCEIRRKADEGGS